MGLKDTASKLYTDLENIAFCLRPALAIRPAGAFIFRWPANLLFRTQIFVINLLPFI
jgi:hypothetical protein